MRPTITILAALLCLNVAAAKPAPAPAPAKQLNATVERQLAEGPKGARYGLLVTTMDGEVIVSIDPDGRYVPASNTKIYTTAAGFAQLDRLQAMAKGTAVTLAPLRHGARGQDVILYGRGDPTLSSADDCRASCLATLADAIAAKTNVVGDVIGDDSWYPDERWSSGMSWNNIQSRYGTGTSALTLDDNEIPLRIEPAALGNKPLVSSPQSYYAVENQLTIVPGKEKVIRAERAPNGSIIRLTGTFGAEAPAETLWFGIDDPAHYAAWRLSRLLTARGVRVTGDIRAEHRLRTPLDDPQYRKDAPVALPAEPAMLSELPAPKLVDDMRVINKVSQNLHAELLLRRISRLSASGSVADGQAALASVMTAAGVSPDGYTLTDGSGMSSYNRITPRATVTLLGWIARQSWAGAYRETLPIGGVDGTLSSRFKGTLLERKIFAKTGSLNAARALSGYMVTKSGRTLIFSAIANHMQEADEGKASAAVDRALVTIADAL